MKLIKSAEKLTNYLNNLRTGDKNVTIGFVPTMGALHKGHSSLIEQSVKENDFSVCSIFVNPTQFGDQKDLDNYPRPIEQDIALLIDLKCDILFLPSVDEIYPAHYEQIHFELGGLDLKIEGAQRPGHFQGVCNVLKRFFEIVQPHKAYFGQKDFQQTVVVKKLIELLSCRIEIKVLPILREDSGLAMSSRNERLSMSARNQAAFIYHSLQYISNHFRTIGIGRALKNAEDQIKNHEGAEIEYLIAVDPLTLEPITEPSSQFAVLIVVKYEGVRLLDNVLIPS